jgi:hypothetical protein
LGEIENADRIGGHLFEPDIAGYGRDRLQVEAFLSRQYEKQRESVVVARITVY